MSFQAINLCAIHPSAAAVAHILKQAGWEIRRFDVDLSSEAPVLTLELHRSDGRWLFARADALGRSTVERFQREVLLEKAIPGRTPMAPIVKDQFLGRENAIGARAMMRSVANYVSDNAVGVSDKTAIRNAFRHLLTDQS